MKVLHVVTDTDRRGAQVFACDLSDAMRRRGHSSDVVALAPGAVGGLDLPVLSERRRQLSSFRGVRALMADADVTVAHGSTTVLMCAISGLGPGRPFVTRQISDTKFWAGAPARRIRVAAYLRLASGVVALAESAADDLAQVTWVPRDKIRVIPNGVPAAAFTSVEQSLTSRSESGLSRDSVVVGYVGALAPEKGVDIAIEAVARLDGVQLLVVGDGPDRQRLESLAAVHPGKVVFTGSLTELHRVYAAMDLLVLPSLGGDSMPAVLIEAGFCQLPAVTTSVGAIPDVVVDGVTGFVGDPGDVAAFHAGVTKLAADANLRKRMGKKANEHCLARFEIDVVAARWESALRAVVERATCW